ncbi:MAG: YqaA family protein, partial [Shewanella sp.]
QGKFAKALQLIERYGVWALLLAWLPVIGDILCLLAGWLKLPVLRATLLIFIGKTVRYFVIAGAVLHWLA